MPNETAPPNPRVRWGILGCARIAERAFIPAIGEARNAELFGIAARDERRAAAWARSHGFRKAYPSYAALLEDPEVDAVYIPLPNHLHAEWTIRAARAGKHVLCEKPLALKAADVKAMFVAAREANVLLMEAFMYRFHPRFEKAPELLRAGTAGDLRLVRATFAYYFVRDENDYRWHAAMGGGALYDLGCYTISAARTVFGAEPVSVFARARLDLKTGIDLATSLILEFPGGRQALLDCAFDVHFQSRLEIAGSEGRLTLPRAFSAKHFDVQLEIEKDIDPAAIHFPASNQHARMVEHFGNGVLNGSPLRYGESDALANARVIDAAFASLASGRWEAVSCES